MLCFFLRMVPNDMAAQQAAVQNEINQQIAQHQIQQQIMFQTQPQQQIQQKPPDRVDNRQTVQLMDGTMVRTSEAMKTMTGNMNIQTNAVISPMGGGVTGIMTGVTIPTTQLVQVIFVSRNILKFL